MLNLPSTMSNLIFTELLLAIVLTSSYVLASEKCIFCRDINCQRSTYDAEEQCSEKLDSCVSVFKAGVVQAQGCLESLEDDWRDTCQDKDIGHEIDCEICVTERCNNVASKRANCLQCNNTEDAQCAESPELLKATQCPIARSGRSFCFASLVGDVLERGCSLTLLDQVNCLADPNCHLCDPLEQPHCNDQIVRVDDGPTTQDPTESTSSSTESTPSSTITTESSSSSTTSTSTSSTTSTSTSSSTSSTTSSSTTSSSTSSTTSSSTNSPETTQSTTEPSTTEEVPTTTGKPNSAFGLNASVFLIFAQLAVCFYNPLK
ncbi:cell wall integrity and stress response component 1 [Drosophila yakuba]|uniref:cell wall integrity and stress response component 1 n=1 Tax=Drosophila yakuba TaxID=7245 RepID=UPI001930791A|nr:cell wall integrity and stress response component 1 [Drosophila yakuba]